MSAALHVGQKVTPDPTSDRVNPATRGRTYTVAKVNPKNVKCTADDGGRGLNYPRELLVPATPENLAAASKPLIREFVPREHFTLGEIVTLKQPLGRHSTTCPMVVIGGTSTRIKVARIGGDDDRYVLIPDSGLIRRDRAWLAGALAGYVRPDGADGA